MGREDLPRHTTPTETETGRFTDQGSNLSLTRDGADSEGYQHDGAQAALLARAGEAVRLLFVLVGLREAALREPEESEDETDEDDDEHYISPALARRSGRMAIDHIPCVCYIRIMECEEQTRRLTRARSGIQRHTTLRAQRRHSTL